MNALRDVKICMPCLYELFDFSLKAEVQRNKPKGVKHHGMATPLAVQMPQTKRKR
jgi:hypothetical protein